MNEPSSQVPGDLADHVRGWPSMCAKVSPQMKAHVIEALHKEGFTRSLSEYMRVVLAGHVAEILGISVTEVLRGQPKTGTSKGRRYMRVK